MTANVVEIVVKSTNETQPGFDEAKASADELASATSALADAQERATAAAEQMAAAQDELADAEARVAALADAQADLASAEERLAAVQADEQASVASLVDAETALAEAQARVTEADTDGAAAAKALAGAQTAVEAAVAKSAETDDAASAAETRLAEARERATVAAQAAADAAAAEAAAQWRAAVAAGDAADAEEGLAAKTEATTATTEESAGASLTAGAALSKFGMLGSMALAGIGYESIKMATSFQSSMEQLVTQAGVPQKELGNLKSGILSMAGAVGFDPNSLATSLYHVASNMASLGANAPTMLNAVKIAAEGAATGGANLEDVTNALTATITSGITGANNFSQAMGALNATVGAGDMKMQDLADALGTGLLASVKGYGVTLNEVGAALATFGDNNIRGAKAGTELRMAVQALASPAATGTAALKSLGLSTTTLAKDMSSGGGLQYAINDLAEHMKKAGYTGSQVGAILTDAFGKKAGVGINILVEQLDRFNSKFPDLEKGATGFGAAWQKTQETTKQRLDDLRATFESLGTAIGTKLLPVISAFAGFLDRNRAVLQALAPIILAIVAAMTLWAGIMKVIDILSDLNPWVLGLMAVIAVTVLVIEHWKTISRVVGDAVDAVRETFVRFGHDVESVFDSVVDFVKDHWKLLATILATVLLGPVAGLVVFLATHFAQVKAIIADVVNWVESHWKEIVAWLVDPVGMAVMEIRQHTHEIAETFDDLRHDVAAILGGFRHDISSAFDGIRHDIASFADWLPHAIETAFDNARHAAASAADGILHDAESAWDSLRHETAALVDDVLAFFKKLPGQIESFLAALPGDMLRIGRNVIDGLIHGIESAAADIPGIMKHLASDVASYFTNPLKIFSPSQVFMEHGAMVVEGLSQGITSTTPRVIQAVTAMGRSLMDAGKAAVTGLVAGMRSMMGELTEVVQALAAEADTAIRARMEISSPSKVTYRHGQAIAQGLETGMLAGKSAVAAAAAQLTKSAGLGSGSGNGSAGTAGGTGGAMTIQIAPGSGGSGLEAQFWTWLKAGVRTQGGDPRIFNKKVQFL